MQTPKVSPTSCSTWNWNPIYPAYIIVSNMYRSSHPEVFSEKGTASNFIKKETLAQVFSCEFCKISKNTFFYRTPLVTASEKM